MQGIHLVESKVDLSCSNLRGAMVERYPYLRCYRSAGEQVKDDDDEIEFKPDILSERLFEFRSF
jgi:hypothetical protein